MSNKFFCKLVLIGLLVTFAPVTFGETCWDKTWYNDSSPANNEGSEDIESQPIDVLNTICPDGSSVIDAHCTDEKGVPFTGFKNDTSNQYVANCTVEDGLICYPYEDGECADFAIQYGCACPTTLPPQTTPPGGSGGRNSSENGSNGNSAFGSYCPCRSGSHKIDGTFYATLVGVLLMLRLV